MSALREATSRPDLVKESLARLEFPAVVNRIAGSTQTAYGRSLVAQLAPLADRKAISQALQEANEAGQLLVQAGPLPIGSGEDLAPLLADLHIEGLRLEPAALRQVQYALEAVTACRQRLRDSEVAPLLRDKAEGLTPLPELAAEIRRCIGPRDELLDSASFELGDLRQQRLQARRHVKRQLERLLNESSLDGVFQELLVTDRNGRYVVPVRADHGGRLKGFVQDVSASGQTLYLEPAAVLDGNNRIQTLEREIEREIERILARLTAQVRKVREPLMANQAILAHLDLRQAVARYARELQAETPELAEEPLLDLKQARHPLMAWVRRDRDAESGDVVPIDLQLQPDQEVLLVSGPNTGGKTVALKTAGLLVLMVRSGLPIPCAPHSRLYPFAPVLADIGDEQSIAASLSTFSGHLLNLKAILASAQPGTLVVLDELGTGTDPSEGAALALAALDLLRQTGARVLATTHLHVIKGYAQLEDRVENAAVEFDPETLQPTYRLHYGIPGASHAFTIAERLGLPTDLLRRAEGYLGQDERSGMAIIERLQGLRVALEEELSSASDLRRDAEQEREHRRRLREDLEEQRREILEETRQQGSRLLSDAEARLRELFRNARPQATKPNQQARLTREVRELRQDLPAPAESGPERVPEEVAVGELLFVPALGVDAEVLQTDARRAELDVGGKRMRQQLKSLRQYQPRKFAAPRSSPSPRIRDRVAREDFRPRLVLVGKRVDEAQELLAKFLDDAMLHGQHQLEVVHGAGQGILRRAVRELLAERSEVARYQAADASRGGDNITLVEIRH